eukprot:12244250-Prorocentrum_lima.AAC.1
MLVIGFMSLSLHAPHERCNIRAAHQQPGKSPRSLRYRSCISASQSSSGCVVSRCLVSVSLSSNA